MPETQTKSTLSQVGAVFVTVKDQDTALEFYCGKLGFEKRADVPYGDGDRWVEVGPPGGEATLALNPVREGHDDELGGMHCSFLTKDIDAAQTSLRDAGVDVDDEIMGGEGPVPKMFFFRDPDGNSFIIVQIN